MLLQINVVFTFYVDVIYSFLKSHFQKMHFMSYLMTPVKNVALDNVKDFSKYYYMRTFNVNNAS